MSEIFTFKISGDKAIIDKFKALESKLQKQTLRPVLRAGAKILLEETRKRAPRDTGAMAKSATVRAATKLRRGSIGFKVVFPTLTVAKNAKGKTVLTPQKKKLRKGLSDTGNRRFYAIHVERGTKYMRAHPFIRPARDAKFSEMKNMVRKAVMAAVQ